MVNLPGNLVKATAGAINTAVNPLITAYEVATNKDVGINDIVDQWKSNAKAGANMIKSDRNVINNLSTGKADVNDIQKATGNDKVKVYYDENDKVQGFHDNDTNDIYLNAANNTATNTDTFVRTYGHETAHDYTQNESVANNAGSYAKGIFNTLNTLSFDSVNTSGNATSKDWLGNQFSNVNSANALANNTIKAGGVVNRSNDVIEVSRNLNNDISKKLNNGKHSYLIIKPNYPEDFTEDKLMERGLNPDKFKLIDIGGGEMGLVNGGYNDENAKNNPDGKNHLISTINQDTDLNLTREINNNVANKDYNPETRIIKPQNGMSDSTFIYNIFDNINNYQNNTENNPVEYKILNQNCNTYSNSLLDYSGADKNRDNNMKGIDPGKNNRIDINNFR